MKIRALSETAVTLTFDDVISQEIHQNVIPFCKYIEDLKFSWLTDLVPAYSSVSVFVSFDFYKENSSLITFFNKVFYEYSTSESELFQLQSQLINLKVNYDGEDLGFVAEYCNLSVNDVIRFHSEAEYTVAMLGFTPGFPYLLGLDERLVIPRRDTPRLKVAAGSVAIGGVQTGIYPKESPGGWHIIGNVQDNLFDVRRNPPNLLKAGDRVKFLV